MQPGVAPRPALLDIHKFIGITLLLALMRLVWRMMHGHPHMPHGPVRR